MGTTLPGMPKKKKCIYAINLSIKTLRFFLALLLLYPQFASADDLNKKINLYLRDTHSAQAADYVTSIIHHYLVDDEVSDSAIMWSDTLRNLGEAKGDLELVAKSDVLTGKYYLRIANDAKALDYFYRALKYYKSVDNLDGEADIYLQIGLVYYLQGQFPDALPNIKLATELYQKTSNDSSLSTTYYLTGLSYLELKNYKQAEIFLQQSLKIGKLLSNNQREYECYVALARLYTNQKNFVAAEQLFDKVMTKWDSIIDPYGYCMALIPYSKLLIKTNKKEAAFINLNRALSIAEKFNFIRFKVDIYKLLAIIYSDEKNFESANYYIIQHYQLRDSIYNSENQRAINTLKAKIEAEKKQAQLDSLFQKEKADQLQKWLLALTIFMLLGLSFGLYRRYNYKQKREAELRIANGELSEALNSLRQVQQQLIHNEKMASLGRMSSGIAHELRNPLNFVINFTKISSELIADIDKKIQNNHDENFEQLKNNLAMIYQHSLRADKIILNFSNHAKPKSNSRTIEDLNKVVSEFTSVAYHSFISHYPDFHCHIHYDFDQSLKGIVLNLQEITTVLLNLLNNAFDAMNEKLMVDKTYKPIMKIQTRQIQNSVRLSISDNGPGIDEENLPRVYEPFFTTKTLGKGTGLGLSLSYDIIKSHNGDMDVKSTPHLETEFSFTLPYN